MSCPEKNSTVDDCMLDRCQAVPALVGKHDDFLIVAGLAGTARDVAALTDDGAHIFAMAGAMGAAAMMGFGILEGFFEFHQCTSHAVVSSLIGKLG